MKFPPIPALRYLTIGATTTSVIAISLAFRLPADPAEKLVERLLAFYAEAQPEVSYLHLNQAAYAAGETVWFKAYVADARYHRLDSLSRVLYVDVVSPSGRRVLLRRTLALRGGLAHGDLALPDTLAQGVYTVRAYTSWMRNAGEQLFFSRRLPVWQMASPATDEVGTPAGKTTSARRSSARPAAALRPDVQFFPEGGDYVAGLATVVGVKAMDATGTGLAVRGEILDEQNQVQASFSTPALGMSSFNFTPAPGRRYHARVVLPTGATADYPLPAALPDGFVMNTREAGNSLKVFIRHRAAAGTSAKPAGFRLLAHVRGTPVYMGQGQIQADETFSASLPKDKMPAGVLHLTLFDDQQQPRAERLAFVPDARPLRVTVRPDKSGYGPREAVTVDVEVRTADGAPAAAELSLAVTSEAGLPATATTDATIESQLLLTSELKGYVENPGYYFRNSTPETRLALDQLLLTQGWSRFVWRELLQDVSPVANYQFLPEQSLSLGGRLVRANQKPVPNGSVTLLQQPSRSVSTGQANAQGQFLFMGFSGQDSTKVVVQARTEKGSSNVLVQLNELWPLPAKPLPLPLLVPAAAPEVAAYTQRSRRQQVLEQQYRPDSSRSIQLRNVTVKGSRPAEPARDIRSIHSNPSAVLNLRDIPQANAYTDIFQLLQGRVAGVQVTRSGSSYNVLIRGITSLSGPSQPLFLLDGVPLSDADALMGISPSIVERIEVLKGPSAAIYGMRGGAGAIAVFTKTGNPDYDYSKEPAAGIVTRLLPAYYRAREFYAPRYEKAPAAARPDPRATTLYWLPRLAVSASGTARFTFYTADQGGTFRVSAEGIGAAGQPALGASALRVTPR
ncbi:TonB-dependent receptor plug domain-containing protein [Hymenobacter sediminicola]|uniref:TonB-dependent receptor plug domain-containing protein n=1 Tax=Hymenobacter sediminicola TaxID=2761579 RepID=A0A7G7W8L0_9BACT|nr:TonB-dependent receptor plug domain-containing protein [Hymenobacter sediminicola]QNH62703.1 TonB-dependent receptor plug domain-containing protein [Hymenobacter sediminicola]